MASEKQNEANRQNAQKSTGPKTKIGKRKSAQNALKHGLFSTSPVINSSNFNESQEEYDLLKDALTQELKPQNIMQTHFVQRIVDCLWRYRRAINAEKSAFQSTTGPEDQAAFWNMMQGVRLKHYANLPEATESDKMVYNEYLANQKPEPPDEKAPIPSGPETQTCGRYESRLDRQLYRAIRLLKSLQRLQSPKPRKRRKKRKK